MELGCPTLLQIKTQDLIILWQQTLTEVQLQGQCSLLLKTQQNPQDAAQSLSQDGSRMTFSSAGCF